VILKVCKKNPKHLVEYTLEKQKNSKKFGWNKLTKFAPKPKKNTDAYASKSLIEVSQSRTLWQRVKKVLLHAVGLKELKLVWLVITHDGSLLFGVVRAARLLNVAFMWSKKYGTCKYALQQQR
jgi:hypothetical protein